VTTDLTSRIAELASLIGGRLEEDEAVAHEAAAQGTAEWSALPRSGRIVDGSGEVVVYWISHRDPEDKPSPQEAAHIARNDPARVLRRVTATRDLIAAILAEPHDWIPGDEFYSCSQAEDPDPAPGEGGPGSGCHDPDRAGDPCDCGRDQRVARLLGIIAGEWEGT
jgi:hypothetical protein